MKNYLMSLGLTFALSFSAVSSDELKNSLTKILNEKDTVGMVNLGNLDLNAKSRPEPVVKKIRKRSAKTIIATVNGVSLRKKDADNYLKKVTGSRLSDFDRLAKKQRLVLIQELARPIVIVQAAKQELSTQEKEGLYRQIWMEKKISTMKVSNEEMLALYDSMKKNVLRKNPQAKIPPYISLGEKLRGQVIEQKIMSELMKNVKVKVNFN